MVMSDNRNTRELDKFVDVAGDTAVRVTMVGGGGGGLTVADVQAGVEAALIAQQQNLPNLTEAQVQAAVEAAMQSATTQADFQATFLAALGLAGLATEAKQDVGNTSLSNIDTDLDDVELNQASQTALLTSIDLKVSGIPNIETHIDLTAGYSFSYKDESGATDDYYIFQDKNGKYYVMKVAKANTGYATYANNVNNVTVSTLADAVSNYLTMTYGEFKDITGGL